MEVEIIQAFDTITHRVETPGAVLKVPDSLAKEWIALGVARSTDEAAAPSPAPKPPKRDQILATQGHQVTTPEDTAEPVVEAEAPPTTRLTKIELLRMCHERGIEASESETKAEILAKLG